MIGRRSLGIAVLVLAALSSSRAGAQEAGSADDLEARTAALEERVRLAESYAVGQRPRVVFGGYVDFGFFAAQGDGSGVITDTGPIAERAFPQLANQYGWVFLGDLLAPAINSRGEPADLGDLPGVARRDPVDSGGAPGFIVNEVSLRFMAAVADGALVTTSVNFTPRSGHDFSLGDVIDLDLAQLEWMLGEERRTSVFVGKFEPVIGIEYRDRKSDRRAGITPSLLARYTTGSPLGLKARSKLGDDDMLVVAAAITNGSSGSEMFHFHDEVDSNAGKTFSGRIALRPPLPFGPELGLSGEYGAQDRALDGSRALWFAGIDLQLQGSAWVLKAQWLRGSGDGETGAIAGGVDAHRPYGLRLNDGAYLEVDARISPMFGVVVRGEFRDARVWLGAPTAPGGAERLYVTKSWRATVGAQAILNDRIILKAEYLRNAEYGGVPEVRNDVFTSSLVLVY